MRDALRAMATEQYVKRDAKLSQQLVKGELALR